MLKGKRYIKIIACMIGILLLFVLGSALKLFVIGEPVDSAQVYCEVTVADQNLELNVSTSASAIAFRGWKFRQEGNTLFVSARKVLVSPLFRDGVYHTSMDLGTIEEISFGGQTIWEKDE